MLILLVHFTVKNKTYFNCELSSKKHPTSLLLLYRKHVLNRVFALLESHFQFELTSTIKCILLLFRLFSRVFKLLYIVLQRHVQICPVGFDSVRGEIILHHISRVFDEGKSILISCTHANLINRVSVGVRKMKNFDILSWIYSQVFQ